MADVVYEEFGRCVGETARAWRARLDERLAPLGLSQARWLVVLHLDRERGGLIQKELAQRLGIEGATLVGLLDRMAADGWVERRECAHDRRSKTVHLTPKSRAASREIKAVAAQLRRELLAGIPRAELECCFKVLGRIKDRAEAFAPARAASAHKKKAHG